jgi:hypothetical protein
MKRGCKKVIIMQQEAGRKLLSGRFKMTICSRWKCVALRVSSFNNEAMLLKTYRI